ncbi:Steryl acetyl hydrolase [Lachnellula subtilissima]|uniref:Steryl acetyl hydrolase n=1 Tax=Lachnellula subtilissima TaxID=602034 RepID=A0A8H8RSU2_9HELO|nr:Steryl acetyl hydrolase [Lachnellula subtilissima]
MSESPDKSQSSSYSSQKATVATLSLFEKLETIPILLTVVGNVLTSLFTAAYRSKDRKPSGGLYKYVMLTALRTLTRRASVRQQHYIAAPTDDNYITACKKRGVQPNSIILSDGTRANWIGDPSAEKLIINFHGGGYTFPAAPEMFEFMFQIISVLQSQGKNVSCLFLSYDLAPARVYPRQLQQAAMLLNHVLHTLHISPSNIILTGDSAGGNLALALLSHISHPHPGLHGVEVPKVELGPGAESGSGSSGANEKLNGIVLISPWVSFNLTSASWDRNKYKDCLDKVAGQQWSSAFLNHPQPLDAVSDYYNQAVTAPESWWEGAEVESVLIVAGREEVLVDGITEFAGKFERGVGVAGNVEFRVLDGFHVQPAIDLQMGYTEAQEGEQAKTIKSWIASHF